MRAFVIPAIDRLKLPDGAWVDVKRELTYGEEQQMFARMRRQMAPGEVPVLDTTLIGLARMHAYIVAWSLTDPTSGQPIPLTPAAIENLTRPMAKAIREALELHEETVNAEREEEKNDRDGAPASSPSSPSVN